MKFKNIAYSLGFIAFILISVSVIITIPSRWRIQKDLETLKPELMSLYSDYDSLCKNDCEPPYPEFFEKALLPEGMLTNDEKEFCRNSCSKPFEVKEKLGFYFILDRLQYLRRNRYYFYSSAINCLIGLSGCPPAFARELR